MIVKKAKFIISAEKLSQCPNFNMPEIARLGRSNVGKSSLINRLFNRKKLAKVSSMPGKTSTINFFTTKEIDFVDLPGYGYAKVAKSEKARWSEMINGYFDQYRYYALVVSLIDIRHPATKLDEQMVNFLTECQLPFMIALTKADKVSKNEASKQKAAIRKQLNLPDSVNMVVCSSEKGTGFDELRKLIEAACK